MKALLIVFLTLHYEVVCMFSSFISTEKDYHRRHKPNAHFRISRSRAHISSQTLPPPLLFEELDGAIEAAELQQWMLTDIGRRRTELLLIGWLGRAYLLAPIFFQTFFPEVFFLEPYEGENDVLFYRYERESDGASTLECVLKESSVVQRGIPIRLRIVLNDGGRRGGDAKSPCVESVEVMAVGCDISPLWPPNSVPLSAEEARTICGDINGGGIMRDSRSKIVSALSDAIFHKLEPRLRFCLAKGLSLVPCCDVRKFYPRHDFFAQEGLHEKWLQKVSGYYFGESLLRDVSFEENDTEASGLKFTFYFDPMEPPNSTERGMNVNPEIICCKFSS